MTSNLEKRRKQILQQSREEQVKESLLECLVTSLKGFPVTAWMKSSGSDIVSTAYAGGSQAIQEPRSWIKYQTRVEDLTVAVEESRLPHCRTNYELLVARDTMPILRSAALGPTLGYARDLFKTVAKKVNHNGKKS